MKHTEYNLCTMISSISELFTDFFFKVLNYVQMMKCVDELVADDNPMKKYSSAVSQSYTSWNFSKYISPLRVSRIKDNTRPEPCR